MPNIEPQPSQPHDFAAAIMNKIETEKIATHSRAWFVMHDLAFWVLWFLSALIGAFSLSAVIFVLQSSQLQLYSLTNDSFLTYTLEVIPYLWLLLFLFMCAFAYFNLRHTPKGYRHSSALLIVLNLSVTLLLSVIVTAAGLGKFVDEQVGKHVPLYSSALHKQELHWFKPDEGLLIGKVVYADQPTHVFILQSPEAQKIDVDGHLLSDEEWQLLKIPAGYVKVIGVPKDAAPFTACIVLPVLPTGVMPTRLYYPERNLIDMRNTECKGVRPYERFDQIKHW